MLMKEDKVILIVMGKEFEKCNAKRKRHEEPLEAVSKRLLAG